MPNPASRRVDGTRPDPAATALVDGSRSRRSQERLNRKTSVGAAFESWLRLRVGGQLYSADRSRHTAVLGKAVCKRTVCRPGRGEFVRGCDTAAPNDVDGALDGVNSGGSRLRVGGQLYSADRSLHTAVLGKAVCKRLLRLNGERQLL